MSKIITCEQVSNGHPDKICDQIADAIVTDVLKHDKNARVAIECLLKKNQLFIAGEMTTDYQTNYHQLVHNVITRIGAEKMGFDFSDRIRIGVLVDKQSPDIALGVDKGGAGDQGIMYGYATNETAEQMPIPYMVATKFLQLLKNHPSKMFRADAKAQVSYDYDTGRISTFLCSVQHSPDVEVSDFRHIIESMMVLAACEYGLDGDFTKLVNKVLGKMVQANGKSLIAFDLTSSECFPKVVNRDGKKISSRQSIFAEQWSGKFGPTYSESRRSLEVKTFDNYTVITVNGKKTEVHPQAQPPQQESMGDPL